MIDPKAQDINRLAHELLATAIEIDNEADHGDGVLLREQAGELIEGE